MLNGCRNTWMVALPLHAHDLKLSKETIGLAVAIFRAVDATVTITLAGPIMDRYGRTAGAIPTLLLMSVAFLLLPWTESFWSMILVAMVYAVGNGLSGGILNYLATGLAPAHARTQFLGLWKTVTSCGGLVLPPLFGGITDRTGSMKASGAIVAGIAVFAMIWVSAVVRDLPQPPARSQDSARARPLVDASQPDDGLAPLRAQPPPALDGIAVAPAEK